MKRKFYAISLLLSFLVVLSHEVISHHHHDDMAYDFSTSHKQVDENAHHQNDNHPHHHDSSDEKSKEEDSKQDHNHPFPFHQHISATNDFNIERTNVLESNSQIRDVALIIYIELFVGEFSKPPNLEGNLYGEPPFLITSLFEPGAIALRGPPAIV